MGPTFRMPLFSPEGDIGGTPAPVVETAAAPAVETPAAPTPQVPVVPVRNQPPKPLISYNPLLQDAPPVVPTPVPVVAPPVIEELDFAGRKVQVVDPVIRDIHKDYSNLQKTFQETNSTVKTLQEQNTMYQNMVQMFQQQGLQAPPPPVAAQEPEAPQGLTPEDNETFMTNFYDSPLATVDQRIEAAVQARLDAVLKPIQQEREAVQREREATNEVQTLSSKYGDFQDHVPAMQEILKNNPQLADQGLETVYFVARGQNQQATPTPQQLLSDPTFRSQLLSDEAFKNEMISNYLQNRTNANQQVPPVMGTQPGGNAPMMPENRPKSIREASKMFAKSLGF